MKLHRRVSALTFAWIVVIVLATAGLVLSAIFGRPNWINIVHGFLLGFGIANLQVVKLLRLLRELREAHTNEIQALVRMNNAEIGAAIAAEMHRRMNDGDAPPTAPRLQ